MANMVSLKDKRTLSVHVEHEFLLKMERAGLTEPFAQKVIDSKGNELAAKVVKFIQNGGFDPTTSQKRAREIMGKNMFGIEEAIQHFGINPTRQQTLALSNVPFLEEILQKAKDTHVLVAIFPLSILEIRGKVDSKLFYDQSWYNKVYDQSWYNKESFAKERGETSWQLVCKTPVSHSTSKNWREQLVLIEENDKVPTAQVMVYTIIGHHLLTGERLHKHIYVRTSSVGSGGDSVDVGFDPEGLDINTWYHGGRSPCLGVSVARKP